MFGLTGVKIAIGIFHNSIFAGMTLKNCAKENTSSDGGKHSEPQMIWHAWRARMAKWTGLSESCEAEAGVAEGKR
jgi:hypothetical protein